MHSREKFTCGVYGGQFNTTANIIDFILAQKPKEVKSVENLLVQTWYLHQIKFSKCHLTGSWKYCFSQYLSKIIHFDSEIILLGI